MDAHRPHQNNKRFYNLKRNPEHNFLDVLKWHFTDPIKKWPETFVSNEAKPSLVTTVNINETYITHINHASVLIQLNNLTILTDPIFSKRASPFSFIGPKRVCPPGLSLDELVDINILLISHNHYDHMDIPSLKALVKKFNPLIIVPLNNDRYLKKHGINNVLELDWWQNYKINAEQSITLVPSQHWSQRGLRDRYKALWGGFVIQAHDLNIYFAGDTGYGPHFKLIFDKLGKMDISLLPIGAYEPRWFMQYHHINPFEAVVAHQELHSELSIGIHFGTFQLTNEPRDAPIEALAKALFEKEIDLKDFKAAKNGQTFYFKK